MGILSKLQNIDRRIMYLLTAAVIAAPLIIRPSRHPQVIFDEVRNAYDVMQNVPKEKIVLLSTWWGAGTLAENRPQTEAIMRQLFRNGTRFAVISWDPVGAELTYSLGTELQKELHKEYGKDWVHLGYNPGPPYVVIRGMATDFPGTLKVDRSKTPLSKLPATRSVKTYKDIGAVAEITPSGTVAIWIAYFTTPYNIPLVFCPTAVMAAEAYPFLDSKQIDGMLNGVIGAAQYETLLGMANKRTYAASASWALSSAHIYIILLIILGNLGYALTRRRARRDRGGTRVG